MSASTFLFLNTTAPSLTLSTVAVTRLSKAAHSLIIRFGATVGTVVVKDMSDREGRYSLPHPMLIPCSGLYGGADYRHGSSIEVLRRCHWPTAKVVGDIGTPGVFDERFSRIPDLDQPLAVLVLPAGTEMVAVPAHSNFDAATATAAYEGMKLRVDWKGSDVVIVKRKFQSVTGIAFKTPNADNPSLEVDLLLNHVPIDHHYGPHCEHECDGSDHVTVVDMAVG